MTFKVEGLVTKLLITIDNCKNSESCYFMKRLGATPPPVFDAPDLLKAWILLVLAHIVILTVL